MDKIPITREGLEKLRNELRHLEKVARPENIRAIEEARAHGDLSENAEYHAAKERQSFIEGRINELKTVTCQAEVIDTSNAPLGVIVFGRTVLLYNVDSGEEVEYQLLGTYESDPEKGKISVTSPLGQALLGRKEGDEITVKTPSGLIEFEIVKIS